MPTFRDLQNYVDSEHGAGSQKATILGNALAAIREAFATLTKHGIHLRLEEGPKPAENIQEWPKAYVNDKGEHLVVANAEMAKNLTEGWKENKPTEVDLDKARQADAERRATTRVQTLGVDAQGRPIVQAQRQEDLSPSDAIGDLNAPKSEEELARDRLEENRLDEVVSRDYNNQGGE